MPSTNRNKKFSRRTIVLALAAFAFFQFAFIGIEPAEAFFLFDWLENKMMQALVGLLYAVFWVVSQPVSIAASILGYAVDPAGWAIFNDSGAYDVWQAVRDFFNLFFILVLLFSAFATIFQVEQYHVRRILPKIVLVALLVNFSWPISRFIVDATNVPMYFFLQSTFTTTPTTSAGQALVETAFSAANMREIILPNSGSKEKLNGAYSGDLTDLSIKLLIAIVFMFIFGVSLLVLAVMFLIRLIMLLILVMFSPVGFAGTAIPGFQKYASEWWSKLMQYALFGPVAALMILVAVTVMRAFKANDQPMKDIAGAVNKSDPTALASMALAIIPIILIWVAITVSQKMGIYGSGAVTGYAQSASKRWGKRLAVATGTVGTAGLGYYAYKKSKQIGHGAKAGWEQYKTTGKLFGKQMMPKGLTKKHDEESQATWDARFKYGSSAGALRGIHEKRVADAKKEFKDSGASRSTLLNEAGADSNNPESRLAAAQLLAENKWIETADELKTVLGAISTYNVEPSKSEEAQKANEQYRTMEAQRLINSVDDKVLKSMTAASLDEIFNNEKNQAYFKKKVPAVDESDRPIDGKVAYEYDATDPKGKTDAHKALDARMSRANKLDVTVEFEANELIKAKKAKDMDEAMGIAMANVLAGKSKKDIVTSAGFFKDKMFDDHFSSFLDTKDRDYLQKLLAQDELQGESELKLKEYVDRRFSKEKAAAQTKEDQSKSWQTPL